MLLNNLSQSFSNTWQPVATSEEVAGTPRKSTLAGRDWVLWRDANGIVHALDDTCPHRGASLSAGRCVERGIQCGYHGWTFEGDGTCVQVPSMRTTWSVPVRFATKAPFAVEERYGLVWLAEDEPVQPIPVFPEWDAPGFVSFALEPQSWRTSAAQMADNFLDLTHFPLLHAQTFADENPVEVQGPDCVPTGTGFLFEYRDDGAMGERRSSGDFETVHYEVQYEVPYWVSGAICYDQSAVRQVIVTALQPQTAESTRLYTLMSRNDIADDAEAIQAARTFQERVADEDRFILEHTSLMALDLDLRRKRSSPSDRVSVEFHRRLAEVTGTESASMEVSA